MMTDASVDRSKAKPPAMTDELLREAIRSKEGRDDVVIIQKQISSDSDEINNYGSVGNFVKVTAEVGLDQAEYNLFIKTAHEDKARKELMLEKTNIFMAEAQMYSEIIPAMMEIQKEKCGYTFGPSVPEYYHSAVSSDRGVVILKNLQPDGYSIRPVQEGLDYEHCKLVMKEIAVFHALSWAIKYDGFDYLKKYPFLSTYFFNEGPVGTMVEKNVESVIELINMRMPDQKVKEATLKLSTMDLNLTMRRLCRPIEPYAVICHGDFHCNNILFKNDDKSGNSSPINVKLIDMQAANYALPTTDLAVFFYSSTTRATRKRHLKDLLRIYHTEFIGCLGKLKIEFQEFTFNTLEDLFAQSTIFGVFMSCLFVPHLLCHHDESSKYAQDNIEDFQKASAEFSKHLPLLMDSFPAVQERLFDNFTDLVENGSA